MPVLSCSVDFYCRVFVLVYTSALEVKKSPRYRKQSSVKIANVPFVICTFDIQ